jgi:hypothetical protein
MSQNEKVAHYTCLVINGWPKNLGQDGRGQHSIGPWSLGLPYIIDVYTELVGLQILVEPDTKVYIQTTATISYVMDEETVL